MMKIEEQILSFEQVQELKNLGFDVDKYSSMLFAKSENNDKVVVNKDFVEIFGGPEEFFGDSLCFCTMTIGDIIEVLPKSILKLEDNREETYCLRIMPYNEFYSIEYIHYSGYTYEIETTNVSYIDALYKILTWCIENKYINL